MDPAVPTTRTLVCPGIRIDDRLPAISSSAVIAHVPWPQPAFRPAEHLTHHDAILAAAETAAIPVYRVSRPAAGSTVGGEAGRPVTMWRDDAFSRTELADRLSAAGRDHLLIIGGHAQIECLATAARAAREGLTPFLVADALVDLDPDGPTAAARFIATRCGEVITTAALLKHWSATTPTRTRNRSRAS